MKWGKYLFFLFILCGLYQSCNIPEIPGSIYGTVEDKATGEPIKSAWVELSSGEKITTGSDGAFEFSNLNPNEYTLFVTKNGYVDSETHHIDVKPNQSVKVDIQIERLPPALKVIDDNRKNIDTLDFGNAEDDVARSFNIFNDGVDTLEWQITTTAEWIKSISKTEGKLVAGAPQSIVMVIDRTILKSGLNKTSIHITSNNGNKQLVVLALNDFQPTTLNTYSVTNNKGNSATLHGEIITDGNPKYTERGFVYATSSMPTIQNTILKVTSPLTTENTYSAIISNLIEGETYYVRAYAINAKKESYSTNEVYFSVTHDTLANVITSAITDTTHTTVNVIGNVINDGGSTVTDRGICYSTHSNPSISDNIVSEGSGLGSFSVTLENLSAGTTYYVCAYAINEIGTSYGEIKSFTTKSYTKPEVTTVSVKLVDNTSAYFIGIITNTGDPEYTERGFIYATIQNPILDDTSVTRVTVEKNSSAQFEKQVPINELDQEVYYVRAYARNNAGVSYGTIVKLDVIDCLKYIQLPVFFHNGCTYRVHPEFEESMDWFQATNVCENLVCGGYSDWVLPSKEELKTMYNNKEQIGGFYTIYSLTGIGNKKHFYYHCYWSRTLHSSTTLVWSQDFTNGNVYATDPNLSFETKEEYNSHEIHYRYRGRCIRKED